MACLEVYAHDMSGSVCTLSAHDISKVSEHVSVHSGQQCQTDHTCQTGNVYKTWKQICTAARLMVQSGILNENSCLLAF